MHSYFPIDPGKYESDNELKVSQCVERRLTTFLTPMQKHILGAFPAGSP
jgi:hypothetical protein